MIFKLIHNLEKSAIQFSFFVADYFKRKFSVINMTVEKLKSQDIKTVVRPNLFTC